MHTKNNEALGAVTLVACSNILHLVAMCNIQVAFFYCLFKENLLYMCPCTVCVKLRFSGFRIYLREEIKYTEKTKF